MKNDLIIINYLIPSIILFLLGSWGLLGARVNMIVILISIELMLLSINFNLVIFSIYLNDLIGQIFALLVLTIAAAESAIGLALLLVYYRIKGDVDVDYINILKG